MKEAVTVCYGSAKKESRSDYLEVRRGSKCEENFGGEQPGNFRTRIVLRNEVCQSGGANDIRLKSFVWKLLF